jgi:RNA polymerase sigma factor (sigma-70 family)
MNPLHDEKTFIEIYNECSDDVFRFCFLRIRDRERALDITQDVFIKLWNEYVKRGSSFADIQNIRAFIFRITRTTLIDSTRKKTSIPFSSLFSHDEPSSAIEPQYLTKSEKNQEDIYIEKEFLHHLDLLDEHHREILMYKFMNDMSIPDIAEIFGLSENATSVRIHRALEHARKKLSHLYE